MKREAKQRVNLKHGIPLALPGSHVSDLVETFSSTMRAADFGSVAAPLPRFNDKEATSERVDVS